MRNMNKTKKCIYLAGILCLCFLLTYISAASDEDTVTMTEYDSSGEARKEAQEGAFITISSLEEFRLFQKHLDEASNEYTGGYNALYGLKFRQEADITAGDYRYTYDEAIDKFVIWHGDDRAGTIDRNGKLFDKDGNNRETMENLGLSELMLWKWSGSRYFSGTYDGQGHTLSGFLLGRIEETVNKQGSGEGGLFCNLHQGRLLNVRVSDCCAVGCKSPLVNTVSQSIVSNCHVENIVGAANAFGGITGQFREGAIQDCTVKNCQFFFRENYSEGDSGGGLGGVVGMIEHTCGSRILGCEVSDTNLYGTDFTQVGVGGIVGISNDSVVKNVTYGGVGYENILIEDCYASTAICGGKYAGGILGKLEKDLSAATQNGEVQLKNCVSEGSISEPAGSIRNQVGGILGGVQDYLIWGIQIENCLSSSKISYESQETSEFGGIVGNAFHIVIDSSVFAGSIETKEGADGTGFGSEAGGIAGYIEGGTVVNSANFGNITMYESNGQECGGLVGSIHGGEIGNSINMGRISGRTAGGLVGRLCSGRDMSTKLRNSLSLGDVEGEVAEGPWVGQFSQLWADPSVELSVSHCFYLETLEFVFWDSDKQFYSNCCGVSRAQLAGAEDALPVFDTEDICSVKEVLTNEANLPDCRKRYSMWEDTEMGYPLPMGMQSILPFVLPEIGSDKLSFKPQATKTPATLRPVPTILYSGSSWETERPEIINTPTPIPDIPSNTSTPIPDMPSNTPYATPDSTPSVEPSTPLPSKNVIDHTPFAPTGSKAENVTTRPTQFVSDTPLPSLAPVPSAKQTPYVNRTAAPAPNSDTVVTVSEFRGKTFGNRCVILSWKKQPKAVEYHIYRSTKKSAGFRQIGKCSTAKTQYKDKKCKPGKRYYYRIRPIYNKDGKRRQGKDSALQITLPWLKTPTFRLSKGKNAFGEKYMQITLKRYAGKYVDIYLKKQNGRYIKASMSSHKIAAYQKKIRFTYKKSGVVYRCKIKTYTVKGGKKRYSGFSKVRKIRL